MPNIEQQRLAHAWQRVVTHERQSGHALPAYRMFVRDIPSRIRTAGLLQAVAWASNTKAPAEVLRDLDSWLGLLRGVQPSPDLPLGWLAEAPAMSVFEATFEALEYFNCVSRLAAACGWPDGDDRHDAAIPAPRSGVADTVRRAVRTVQVGRRHPGLQLDVLVGPVQNQQEQAAAIDAVCNAKGDPALLTGLLNRRNRLLAGLPHAASFQGVLIEPLTLHLSRPGVLENAGLALHPLYGFAYVPGTGVKGAVRAWAETEWVPAQDDKRAAWALIERVFGWAEDSDDEKDWKPPNAAAPEHPASVGCVVFHDAWPVTWPSLSRDITNNHHRDYYGAKEDDAEDSPGDWESPNIVSFLTVPEGTAFSFRLSARHPGMADEVHLATSWLRSAMTLRGAGAKTGTGYGAFEFRGSDVHVPVSPRRARVVEDVTLVTPAFLAGAQQKQEDCTLRGATLKPLLRWWWRTMHAGFVDVPTLRRLDKALWGSTEGGGAITLVVRRGQVSPGASFDRAEVVKRQALPKPPSGTKQAQGLLYHSYGMDDNRKQDGETVHVRRHYLPAGAQWTVALSARDARLGTKRIEASAVLDEARAALWLLCHFGGVGSKGRKGFGSLALADSSNRTTDTILQGGARFRAATLGTPGKQSAIREAWVRSSSLAHAIDHGLVATIPVACSDPWRVLDAIGYAAQSFASQHKHHREKKALGLPRRVGDPQTGAFTLHHLVSGQEARHAAPIHYHLSLAAQGGFVVNIIAFPSHILPDLDTSTAFLTGVLTHLRQDLPARCP